MSRLDWIDTLDDYDRFAEHLDHYIKCKASEFGFDPEPLKFKLGRSTNDRIYRWIELEFTYGLLRYRQAITDRVLVSSKSLGEVIALTIDQMLLRLRRDLMKPPREEDMYRFPAVWSKPELVGGLTLQQIMGIATAIRMAHTDELKDFPTKPKDILGWFHRFTNPPKQQITAAGGEWE